MTQVSFMIILFTIIIIKTKTKQSFKKICIVIAKQKRRGNNLFIYYFN